jgi:hypothetical protein
MERSSKMDLLCVSLIFAFCVILMFAIPFILAAC